MPDWFSRGRVGGVAHDEAHHPHEMAGQAHSEVGVTEFRHCDRTQRDNHFLIEGSSDPIGLDRTFIKRSAKSMHLSP
jgi:hypothetical protein